MQGDAMPLPDQSQQTSGLPDHDLTAINDLIDKEVFLRLSIVDLHVDDGTLVVMTDNAVPRLFVKLLLKRAWNGPVEVYCASAIMDGSMMNLM